MNVPPVLKAMRGSVTGFTLIGLQVALTIAVVVNAYTGARFLGDQVVRETGIDEANLLHIQNYGFASTFNARTTVLQDLDYLRSHPSIVNAVQSNAVPLSNSGWYNTLRTVKDPDSPGINAAVYMVDEHGLETLGLELLYGRNFVPSEIVWWESENPVMPPAMIVTEKLVERLFPDDSVESALGKMLYYDGERGSTVVGIVRLLPSPAATSDTPNNAFLVGRLNLWPRYNYLIRAHSGQRDSLIPELEKELSASNKDRTINYVRALADTKRNSVSGSYIVVWIFGITTVLLTGTTLLSIVGVTSFNVKRRSKQIGIRRVLGATYLDIVKYFISEILIVLVIGICIGTTLAVYLNSLLIPTAEFPKVDWLDIGLIDVLMLTIGICGVLGPTLQVSSLAPAEATRTA